MTLLGMHQRLISALALVFFSLGFVAIAVCSYTQKSATYDETQYVVGGYTSLKLHDYRIYSEHPPLLRMWAGTPLLLANEICLDTNTVEWAAANPGLFVHRFLYHDNDGDRLLYRARFMIVLLGVMLGICVFAWAKEMFGLGPAIAVLALYCVEPNIQGHSQLVTTDLGVTCFFFLSIYMLWRWYARCTWGRLFAVAVAVSAALLSKANALLLIPMLVVILAARLADLTDWPIELWKTNPASSRAARFWAVSLLSLATLGIWVVAVWTIYGYRYLPTTNSEFIYHLDPAAWVAAPRLTSLLNWIDSHHLMPNAYVRSLSSIVVLPLDERVSYLCGGMKAGGWWWYFPLAFLIKTPFSLVLLAMCGMGILVTRLKTEWRQAIWILAPSVIYMGLSMTANANLGLRHILPVYPFVILLAGKSIVWLQGQLRGRIVFLLVMASVLEAAWIYPDHLAYFNAFVGGPRNGHKYLVDSNLDWGQDLKGLSLWMKRAGVKSINLSYFGTADPAYYGIHCTYLPGSPFFVEKIEMPRLPGYVAVSATCIRQVRDKHWRTLYEPLLNRPPDAIIGNSIYVWWVETPWW